MSVELLLKWRTLCTDCTSHRWSERYRRAYVCDASITVQACLECITPIYRREALIRTHRSSTLRFTYLPTVEGSRCKPQRTLSNSTNDSCLLCVLRLKCARQKIYTAAFQESHKNACAKLFVYCYRSCQLRR